MQSINNSNRPKSSSKFMQQQLPADQLARNAKIINRKQLQKRIQGLKEDQYLKICNNLTNQNKRLKGQVKMLNEKVQQLILAKKLSKASNKNPQVQQQILRQKRQLELKYQSMNYLKQQIKKRNKEDLYQDLTLKQRETNSQLIVVQKQLSVLQKQKKKLHQLLIMNQADMNQYHPMSNTQTQSRIQAVKIENKDIRNQINQIQNSLKQKQKDSILAIGKIYDLKKTQENHLKSILSNRTIKTPQKSIDQLKYGSLTQLQKQIQQLKKRKKDIQKDLTTEKSIKESKKNKMQKQIRESLQYHKQLFKRRVKAINQLNYYEKKQKQYQDSLVEKTNIKPKQYIEGQMQTQKFYQKQFRKDWIGNVTGPTFDDGQNMEYKSQVQIKSVTIYLSKQYIAFVKFHYQAPNKKKYETQVPFSTLILKNYQTKKLTARSNGFLMNMKISLTDKKVTKIDFKWSDGQTISQGWDADNSTKYQFDIQGDQRPISISGSVSYQGKNMYALESLGCQISQIQQ